MTEQKGLRFSTAANLIIVLAGVMVAPLVSRVEKDRFGCRVVQLECIYPVSQPSNHIGSIKY